MKTLFRIVLLMTLPLLMTACGSKEPAPAGVKIGKPYQIYGKWYKPAFDSSYDETGIASWYGPGFHGNYTASGEKFDKNAMTAAHATLPMPCMVRVTNLDNGKSVMVRVNDRGPFKANRIIDLSKRAATELDMLKTGTARVRVQYLPVETERYLVDNDIKGRDKILNAPSTKSLNKEQLATLNEPSYSNDTADAAPVAPVGVKSGPIRIVTEGPFSRNDSVEVTDVAAPAGATKTYDSSPSYPAPIQVAEATDSKVQTDESQGGPGLKQAFDYADAPAKSGPTPAAAVESAKPATSESGIFIQAGTFGSRENAERLVKKLGPEGQANVAVVSIGDKTMYRVRMGPLPSVPEATATLQKVHGMGITDARLIKN